MAIPTVNVGGKSRPIDFGLNTLIAIGEARSMPYTKVLGSIAPDKDGNMDLGAYRELVYQGLYYGEVRLAKQESKKAKLDFTREDVGDWVTELMQEDRAKEIMDKLQETMPIPVKGVKGVVKKKADKKTVSLTSTPA